MKMRPGKIWLEISQRALRQNITVFRHHLPKTTAIMAVVKANAYGHGLKQIASVLKTNSSVAWFGVDNIDEAVVLRKEGIRKPILVLGYTEKHRLEDCARHDVSIVVYNQETIQAAKRLKIKKPLHVHLKIETGTTRQGVADAALMKLVGEIRGTKNVVIEGVSTHFANAEEAHDLSYARTQIKRFAAQIDLLKKRRIDPPWKHAACSSAALLLPDAAFSMIRLGISMYGLWPSEETLYEVRRRDSTLQLQPVLTWKTIVAQIKKIPKGTPVGYNRTEFMERDSTIAVLPLGYVDGLPRALSSKGSVLIRGTRCRIIGRICMNMCMVDVTDIADQCHVEDEVVILGAQKSEEMTADEIATQVNTIHYEIVARINPSLSRIIR